MMETVGKQTTREMSGISMKMDIPTSSMEPKLSIITTTLKNHLSISKTVPVIGGESTVAVVNNAT